MKKIEIINLKKQMQDQPDIHAKENMNFKRKMDY